MKREIILFIMVVLCLTGCGREENPYRVDTVIQIPVDPTEAPTEPEATKIETEPETAPEETGAPTEKPSSPQKSSGGSSKKNSGTSSGSNKAGTEKSNKKNTSTDTATTTKPVEEVSVQTEPKETAPAATQPPQTEPPTEPPTIPPTEPPYDPSGYRVGSLEYAVLDQINGYREEAGLPPLSMDEGLCAVASVRAYEISVVWSHTRPDGRSYASVLSDYSYNSSGAAENMIYTSGNGDAAKMVAKWMSADKNCSTLMSGEFTTAGIGIYRSGGVTYLANLLIG